MIRKAHERPEAMDEGTVIMSGLQKNRIIESINITLESFKSGYIPNTVFDYDIDNVSVKVVKIIFSYVDYINSNTWKKIPLRSLYKINLFEGTCYITVFLPWNFRINDLCNGLKDKGIDVTVLTAKPNYPRGKFLKDILFLLKILKLSMILKFTDLI